jgi:peptidoglycan/LPS O-acetylase OafA/YrhL
MSVASRVFGFGPIGSLGTFAAVVTAALLLGAAFWWAIERPSHALARRIGRRRQAILSAP